MLREVLDRGRGYRRVVLTRDLRDRSKGQDLYVQTGTDPRKCVEIYRPRKSRRFRVKFAVENCLRKVLGENILYMWLRGGGNIRNNVLMGQNKKRYSTLCWTLIGQITDGEGLIFGVPYVSSTDLRSNNMEVV